MITIVVHCASTHCLHSRSVEWFNSLQFAFNVLIPFNLLATVQRPSHFPLNSGTSTLLRKGQVRVFLYLLLFRG